MLTRFSRSNLSEPTTLSNMVLIKYNIDKHQMPTAGLRKGACMIYRSQIYDGPVWQRIFVHISSSRHCHRREFEDEFTLANPSRMYMYL